MTELADTERETLGFIAGRIGGWPGTAQLRDPELFTAVEAILTARLARVEALADEWEATPDADLGMSQPYAAAALRAAIAAPTPGEGES